MNWLFLVICAALGFATAQVLIPILWRKTTRTGARTLHHTHKTPVSRFGGVALAAAFTLLSLVAFIWFPAPAERVKTGWVIFVSALAIFFLGLWDDIRPLGPRKKLLGQILISLVVCYFGIRIEVLRNPFTGEGLPLGIWGYCLTVLWLVALTNVINLIDGIDGLAGGISLMMMTLLAYVGADGGLVYPILIAAGMAGALLGFLRYNFPPARIYMGDGGAYLLGYLIAILTLVHSQKGTIVAALIAPMFALALPIADVGLAILRRAARGLPLFRPDRKHLHHKLQELGFSRTRTVLIMYGISSIFLLMAFGVFWSQGRWVPILFGFGFVVLILSARSFHFSRDWFAIGRVLENSAELRKETQYALAFGRWLELDAERTETIGELWSDFGFAAKKLGFTRVRLELADGERLWSSETNGAAAQPLRQTYELNLDGAMKLEFGGDAGIMSKRVFEQLSELAAEAWLQAASRWRSAHGKPVRFGPLPAPGFSSDILPAPQTKVASS